MENHRINHNMDTTNNTINHNHSRKNKRNVHR